MKKQTIFWIGIFSLSLSVSVFAQNDNGQAGGFLRYGVGGRALGMGRAFTAVANGASGVYWNPAGIMGAEQMEFTSMYANLFYDSQYAHFGLVVPRPLPNVKNPFLRFLLGPSSSIGFGWVGLSMVGFEQRTDLCEYLGDFGFQENALMFSWSKELLPSWGVIRTGITLKLAGQDFTGLEAASNVSANSQSSRKTVGADIGLTFKPIHAPVFNLISLKYLLPLTFGLTVKNAIQPRWNSNQADIFPRSLRFGLSYRWILRDWIPDSWGKFKSMVEDCQILTAFDQHLLPKQRDGIYAGAELFIPIADNGVALYPRLGFNNQTDGASFGFGMELPFTSNAFLRVDYVYSNHPYLNGDSRFFLTLKTGEKRNSKFFSKNIYNLDLNKKERLYNAYEVLVTYPNDDIQTAVEYLISEDDTTHKRRYLELDGGLRYANSLFKDMKDGISDNNWSRGRRISLKAVNVYTSVYTDAKQNMYDDDLLNYSEALLVSGYADSAFSVLNKIDNSSWKLLHLKGVCKLALDENQAAQQYFKKAVKYFSIEDSTGADLWEKQEFVSKRALSAMEYAVALIQKKTYKPALKFLGIAQKNMVRELEPGYLHYPPYYDNVLNDDAQFLKGLCLILDNQYTKGIAELQKTDLLYFMHDYGKLSANYTTRFLDLYRDENFTLMQEEAEVILDEFMENRNWINF